LGHVSPVRLEALSDANLSAVSFPGQPQWLGIQCNTTLHPAIIVNQLYNFRY
jgi:hypothetical protein